jgi:hypothetical protein
MYELFNWHDTRILIEHNIWWLLLAFGLGLWTGYRTSEPGNI